MQLPCCTLANYDLTTNGHVQPQLIPSFDIAGYADSPVLLQLYEHSCLYLYLIFFRRYVNRIRLSITAQRRHEDNIRGATMAEMDCPPQV
jgi:hypothetical protein